MNSRDVMQAARRLTKSGAVQPTQTDLRRAVSTACYAMLHILARTAADLLAGIGLEWRRVYLCDGRKSVRANTMNQRFTRPAIDTR